MDKKKQKSCEVCNLDSRQKELLDLIASRVPYGEIVIETRAGLPYRVKKITEYHLLDTQ